MCDVIVTAAAEPLEHFIARGGEKGEGESLAIRLTRDNSGAQLPVKTN